MHTTSIGGLCTIISILLLGYWLLINLLDTFRYPGKFTTVETVDVIKQKAESYSPIYIPQEKMFTAYFIRQRGISPAIEEEDL